MPLKSSTLTFLLAGLLCLGPGLEIPASAKGLLSFRKKKESVAPAPPASGGTVYLTKYGPLTAAQFKARLKLEQEKVNEAVRRAAAHREAESAARQKSIERAAREKAMAAEAAAKKAADERARADRLASKNLAAQKKAEADRARAEHAEKEKEKKRLLSSELKARKIAEEQEAAENRAIAASTQTPAADLSPKERMKAMERIARDLASQRKDQPNPGSGRTEIVSASSLGLTTADRTSAPAKKGNSGSKIERLNQSIFDIVRQRKAAGSPLKRMVEGELYLTTKTRTPFYYFNPLQLVVPDLFLDHGTQVALVKRGKIWSDVRLEDGKEGVIANDFLKEAPIVEIELPVDNAVAATGGSSGFQYTAIPKDFVPPELPGESDFEDRLPSPLLLPPLRSE